MVDFSDREEVRRWLDAIKPEKRRCEVAVALAARAALRVAPQLGQEQPRGKRKRERILSTLVLPCLRAGALAWVSSRYPTHLDELLTAAAAGSIAAGASDFDEVRAAVLTAAALARAVQAAWALNDDEAADPMFDVTANAAAAVAFAGKIAADAAYVYAYAADGAAYLTRAAARAAAYTAADAAVIDSGRSAAELAGAPLWMNGAPRWAAEVWRDLKSALLAADENWDVWTDWYEARLAGDAAHPPNESLEVARATIPEEIWKQGPAVVNAEIKRLIAEHQSLQQRPAAFQFRVVDDKIDSLPDDARPIDPETARDFYDEAKCKGREVAERLQRVQADENIRAHVDLLLSRLGASYADMRPGLMISALRSLESDVRAYDSEEGHKELSAAHLSSIFNLADSVRDLCAIFPRSREIEAEAVSLDLPMRRLPEIRETIDLVLAKVNHSDGATEGGREAVNASAAGLGHQRDLAEEAKQSAYFLVDFANFARAGVKYLKVTGRAVGGEIAGLGADSWRAIRRGAPKGVERGAAQAGKALVVGGVAVLMHWLGSDIAALGAMVGPYLPLHEMLEKMTGAGAGAPAPEPDADAASSEDADDAPAPRPSTPRKPTARKREKT